MYKPKYPDLDSKALCQTCLGCSQLEIRKFRGKAFCEYYIQNNNPTNKDNDSYGSKYGNSY